MLPSLRFAVRSLLRTPGFTLVALLTLAIAIGACTALFSVLQAVVFRPLAYARPDELVAIWANNASRNLQASAISWDKYREIRDRPDVFSDVCLSAGNSFSMAEGLGDPEQLFGQQVTANFLPLLGLNPVLGRNFTAEEDRTGGPLVAMLSHRVWQTRFGGDRSLLGRVVRIDGVPREIVGILPDSLPAPFNGTDILVPQARELPYLTEAQRDYAVLHLAIARLAPGVSPAAAGRRVAEMGRQFAAAHPGHLDSANVNDIRTLGQLVLGNLGQTFWLLAGAVAAVLLIACANIANLFLARVSSRQKEIAVRLSLGARPFAVIGQFLTESLVFTTAATALGVLLAWWCLRGIVLLAGPGLPRADEITLDPGTLVFAVALALLTGLLIGLYPAWQAARTDLNSVLKDATRGAGGGARGRAFRQLLVVAQVALSVCLLLGAGLLLRSYALIQQARPGFEVAGRAYGFINLPAAQYPTPERVSAFYQRLQEQLRQTPELAHGGVSTNLPLAGNGFYTPYAVKGRPVPPINERNLALVSSVTADTFTTLGMRLRLGRPFSAADTRQAEPVAIINETLARRLFPTESPLGQTLLVGAKADIVVRIVAVLQDVRTTGLNVPPVDEIYYPLQQRGPIFANVVGEARPGLDAAAVIPALRRALREVDPTLALATPQTMEELVAQSVAVQRLTMTLLLVFSVLATFLAAVGLYSVLAYAVTLRAGEIGVRLALGASPAGIRRMILLSGVRQAGLGLAIGLVAALAGGSLLQGLLFSVSARDPVIYAGVSALFSVISLIACLLPAQHAMRIDPIITLRSD